MEILVPQKGRIPFRKISAADMERAADALRTIRSTPKEANLPRGAGRTVTSLRKSLVKRTRPEGTPPPSVEARTVRAGTKMIVLITVHNLPLDLAQSLMVASGGNA
jgi:hypothetical protein